MGRVNSVGPVELEDRSRRRRSCSTQDNLIHEEWGGRHFGVISILYGGLWGTRASNGEFTWRLLIPRRSWFWGNTYLIRINLESHLFRVQRSRGADYNNFLVYMYCTCMLYMKNVIKKFRKIIYSQK